MTAKFGEAQRRAFFAGLRATGNQTLAAEEVGEEQRLCDSAEWARRR